MRQLKQLKQTGTGSAATSIISYCHSAGMGVISYGRNAATGIFFTAVRLPQASLVTANNAATGIAFDSNSEVVTGMQRRKHRWAYSGESIDGHTAEKASMGMQQRKHRQACSRESIDGHAAGRIRHEPGTGDKYQRLTGTWNRRTHTRL